MLFATERMDQLPWTSGSSTIFDFEASASAVITNAANLNVLNWLTFDIQRLNAVHTIAHPFPTAGAPVEVGIEMARHHVGSTRVFSRISLWQLGQFAGCSKTYLSRSDLNW
jgi:hypothetical protein